MEIEVKSVLVSIYGDWPRIRQTLNKPQKGMFRARTLDLEGWWDWSKKFSANHQENMVAAINKLL